MSLIAIIISALALAISAFTLWLSHFRRGQILMTRPTVIFFGPDSPRKPEASGLPKVFLRALLISTSKRGRIVQSLWATLKHKETRQNFNLWVYGDERLVRGSGLHINDTGLATNHHFLLAEKETGFQFREGDYQLEVFAQILGDTGPKLLFSESLNISTVEAAELAKNQCGLYFDWGPQANAYHTHLDRKPREPDSLRDALTMLVGENSGTVPETTD